MSVAVTDLQGFVRSSVVPDPLPDLRGLVVPALSGLGWVTWCRMGIVPLQHDFVAWVIVVIGGRTTAVSSSLASCSVWVLSAPFATRENQLQLQRQEVICWRKGSELDGSWWGDIALF